MKGNSVLYSVRTVYTVLISRHSARESEEWKVTT